MALIEDEIIHLSNGGEVRVYGYRCWKMVDLVGKPMEDRLSNESNVGEDKGIKQSIRKVGQ